MKKVVITGASGFLGSHLIPLLLNEFQEVVAITSKSRNELLHICGIKDDPQGLSVVSNEDINEIQYKIANSSRLINCAFPRGKDGEAYGKGLRFIADIFRIANECGVEAVINISSQSVYNQYRTEPATEETPVCLETKYAVAKYSTELLAEAYCKDIYFTNIRLGSLIGPGFDQRVVNRLILMGLRGEEIYVQENGNLYGYIDIRDAIAAIYQLLTSDCTLWRRTYNLGIDGSYTLTEITESIVNNFKLSNIPIRLDITEINSNRSNSEINCALFKNSFNWKASLDLDNSIRFIMQHEVN